MRFFERYRDLLASGAYDIEGSDEYARIKAREDTWIYETLTTATA